jgi:DNA-binding SARP family transcriptional activator
VEFAILGRLVVRDASGPVRVAGARRRALLVRLLLAAPDGLTNERLAEDVWGSTLDCVSPSTVRSHVCLLRRVLGGDRILGNGDGYVLRFEPDELDATLLDRERRAGHAALGRGDAHGAIVHLEHARSLWRDTPLIDVTNASWALPEIARLEEVRVETLGDLLDAQLLLGDRARCCELAEVAVAEYPLHERFWHQLIVALYRTGRQADALRAYERVRRVLAEEVGIEPSPSLRDLENAVLHQDPRLEAHAPFASP